MKRLLRNVDNIVNIKLYLPTFIKLYYIGHLYAEYPGNLETKE